MKTYDTHAHLDHVDHLEEALANAKQAGVCGIVAMSMDYASCLKNWEISRNYHQPKIYCAMGMHPSEAKLEDLEKIAQLIKEHSRSLAAVGEIGLDFWYKWVRKDQEKKDTQRKVFRTLLEVAKEVDLPVVIHARGVWRECLTTTQEVGIQKANFHWYSGPVDVLKDILNAGYFISTSPSVAYSPQSQEAVRFAPIEQTLIETDSPVFYSNREQSDDQGFKAQPKDVFKTLEAYCRLKGLDPQEAVTVFNKNTQKFFQIKECS